MKRFSVLLLLIVLVLQLAAPVVSAEVIDSSGGAAIKPVTVTQQDTPDTTVYSVSIAWGSMDFQYTPPSGPVWDPTSLSYSGTGTEAVWSVIDNGNIVIISNRSDADVKVELSYLPASSYESVTGSFDMPSLTLESAVGKQEDELANKRVALTLSGELPDSAPAEKTEIGKVRISIGPA